jgi:MFS transporter, putative metabolite:H+ symporter
MPLGRAVNIVVPYVVVGSFDSFGLYGVLGLITMAQLLQIFVLLVAGIEMKQRSLEDLATGTDIAGPPAAAGVVARTEGPGQCSLNSPPLCPSRRFG